MTNRFLIENGGFGTDNSQEYQKLNAMVDYCNTEGCLRKAILTYFGQEALSSGCDNCSNCNNEMQETDITVDSQKIMSCIKRMNEQFGSTLVTDVLKGANTQKIRDLSFNLLSTYGIMKEYPKETIKELISFLIAEGYLALVGDQYPILRLTLKSYEVLKGHEKVTIRRVLIKEQYKAPIETAIKDDLFNNLRQIRAHIAREHQVQPFMIFPDTTLRDMCKKYPDTKEKMLQVSGVGDYKLEKYGDVFIACIAKYMEENDIPSLDREAYEDQQLKTNTSKGKKSTKDSHIESYTLYKEGLSISEIAQKRELTLMTVENHLLKCFEEGFDIEYEQFVPRLYEEQIAAAIGDHGTEYLKPIKEALPEEISYTAIKFVICKYNKEKQMD